MHRPRYSVLAKSMSVKRPLRDCCKFALFPSLSVASLQSVIHCVPHNLCYNLMPEQDGAQIIEALISNSSTFQSKTEFSQVSCLCHDSYLIFRTPLSLATLALDNRPPAPYDPRCLSFYEVLSLLCRPYRHQYLCTNDCPVFAGKVPQEKGQKVRHEHHAQTAYSPYHLPGEYCSRGWPGLYTVYVQVCCRKILEHMVMVFQ
jgi:hypothetical protein